MLRNKVGIQVIPWLCLDKHSLKGLSHKGDLRSTKRCWRVSAIRGQLIKIKYTMHNGNNLQTHEFHTSYFQTFGKRPHCISYMVCRPIKVKQTALEI